MLHRKHSNQLCCVAVALPRWYRIPYRESGRLLAALDVPQLRRVVHTAGGECRARRVERDAHHFGRVPAQRVEAFARVGRPEAALLVERAGRHLVATHSISTCCVFNIS